MTDVMQAVHARLEEIGVPVRAVDHAPAFTLEECAAVEKQLGALIPKNIFLTTKNEKQFYLCILHPRARFRTADVSRQAGSSRLSFAGEDHLYDLMRTRPGSISPMGLMFDVEKRVNLLVDRALLDEPELGFHPCDNRRTLAISTRDFFGVLLPALDHPPRFVEIHDFMP